MGFQYPEYKNQEIQCPHCNWMGKGSKLSFGEYHAGSNIADLDCPSCHQHISFVQFPVDRDKPYDKEEDKKYW